jgi:two-component system sensor histidine kinase CiaH
MFNQTRRRLVILNSVVFLLVLVCFSVLLYVHMEFRLFHQSDEALTQVEQRIQNMRIEDMLRSTHPEPEMDRRTTYLFWNARGELIDQLPKYSFSREDANGFKGNLSDRTIRTISFHKQSYRVLQFPASEGAQGPSQIAAVGLVKNLEAEESMLSTLKWDIAEGIIASGIISVLAGFFLAGRALVPIRRSWDKQHQFVADASHELRTPTAVIQAQTELLFRHPDHSIKQESQNIVVILKESKRMGKLIDDLLTLARTDSNQLQIQAAFIPLHSILEDVIQQFQSLADIKNVRIITEIQGPISLWGDEERVRQLLVIVLDNALKFTSSLGNIEVKCQYVANSIQLSVKDSGYGIPAEDLPHIFERFYRGDKARSRSEGGTGLGLSIAKWIVEAHGGEIGVQSQISVGTELQIVFPRKRTERD